MKKTNLLNQIKVLTYWIIGLSLFSLINGTVTAQTIKLKTSEGYIKTKDSVQLYYKIQGEGKDTLVVVHGGPYNSGYLSPDLLPLAAHHTLLYYDQRAAGFSSSVSDTTKLGITNYIEDLETIRKHFNINNLNLLGHSTGGIFCGYYAATYPERINSMILLNPVPAKAGWKISFGSQLDSMSKLLKKQNKKKFVTASKDTIKSCWDYYALDARGFYPSSVMARRMWGDVCNCNPINTLSWGRNYIHKSFKNHDITNKLKKVTAPVLIIGGELDGIPMESFEEWKNSFPNSTLIKVPNSGHFPHVDEPNAFFMAVELFMQNKSPKPSIFNTKGAGIVLPQDETGTPYQQARAAVIKVENELIRQVNNANWAGVSEIYRNDAWIMAPGAPPITGRQAIESFWYTTAIRGMHSLELQLMDVESSGDLLFGRGKYTMKNNQNEFLDIGKFVAIYKKVNQKWVLYTDIFNSSLETRSPIAVPDYLIPDNK